jgi:hypothetical protein
MKTSEMIEWQESRGGSMGPHRNLMIDKKYVGHLYEDASDGINVRQVLEDIEIRYNSHDKLVTALRAARDDIDERVGVCALLHQINEALKYARA